MKVANEGLHIEKVLALLDESDYAGAKALLGKIKSGDKAVISILLSLTGLTDYLIDKNNCTGSLALINDGAYMAAKNEDARAVNEFALGCINYAERNGDAATIHFKNVLELASDRFALKERVKRIDFSLRNDPLMSLVKIGRSISALTDIDVLLKVIAEETTFAIGADRCTVFLLDKEKDELWSMVALGSEEIRFPSKTGLAGFVATTGETVNIVDAYNDERFNKEFDTKTGYKTKTVLCMPIKNNNQEIIGAFQVLNKLDGVFTKNDEDLLAAIGGSASVALENAQLFKEQKELFENFIDTLATSIDARDKITAGHSSRVRMYSVLIADELGLDFNQKELIAKAATLHDIGKIGIRDSVLQKEGKLTDEEYTHIKEHAQITQDILAKIHGSRDFKAITDIASSHHEKWDGSGYYLGLSGENIPYGGRILAVADVFDAITSKRHYRDKMPITNVIKILINDSNKHFDGNLVDTFLKVPLDKIVGVFICENHDIINLSDDDKNVLTQYNLYDIYKETSTSVTELFNKYYMGK